MKKLQKKNFFYNLNYTNNETVICRLDVRNVSIFYSISAICKLLFSIIRMFNIYLTVDMCHIDN